MRGFAEKRQNESMTRNFLVEQHCDARAARDSPSSSHLRRTTQNLTAAVDYRLSHGLSVAERFFSSQETVRQPAPNRRAEVKKVVTTELLHWSPATTMARVPGKSMCSGTRHQLNHQPNSLQLRRCSALYLGACRSLAVRIP